MASFDLEPVYSAIGAILKKQRTEIDASIASSAKSVAETLTPEIVALKEADAKTALELQNLQGEQEQKASKESLQDLDTKYLRIAKRTDELYKNQLSTEEIIKSLRISVEDLQKREITDPVPLVKAVEEALEKVAEQSASSYLETNDQLSATVKDVAKKFQSIEGVLTQRGIELTDRIAASNAKLNDAILAQTVLREKQEDFDSRLQTVSEFIEGTQEKLATFASDEVLKKNIQHVLTTLQELDKHLTGEIKQTAFDSEKGFIEVDTRLKRLQGLVEDLPSQSEVGETVGQVVSDSEATLRAEYEESLKSIHKFIQDRIVSIEKTIDELPEPLTYDDDVARLQDEYTAVSTEVEKLKEAQVGVDRSVDQRISSLQSATKDLNDKISSLPEPPNHEETFKSISDNLGEITEALIELQEKHLREEDVAELRKTVDETSDRLDSIDQYVYELKNARENLYEGVKGCREEQLTIKGDLEKQTDRLSALEVDFGDLEDAQARSDEITKTILKDMEDLSKQEGPQGSQGPQGEKGEPGTDGLGIETKAWERGVYRKGVYVSFALGKVYRAVEDTADRPGSSKAWVRIGTFGFEFKGVKDKDAEYEVGDLYVDNGSCFLMVEPGKAKMVAQRGRDADPRVLKGIEDHIKELQEQLAEARKAATDGIESNQELALALNTKFEAEYKRLEALVYKILGEEEPPEPEAIKIGWFHGIWLPSQSYRPGDVVRDQNGVWLNKKAVGHNQPMDAEHWVQMAGGSGGGGVVWPSGNLPPVVVSTTITGDTQDFTLAQNPLWILKISVNGSDLGSNDYSISGKVITFTYPLVDGDELEVWYYI